MYKSVFNAGLILACIAGFLFTQEPSLNGTWKPVRQEMNGKNFPITIFTNQELTIQDSIYIMRAESDDKGTVRTDGYRMDLTGQVGVNKGRSFKAIYKLNTDTLTVCYDLTGKNYPEAFTTAGHPAFFMSVFLKKKSD